MRAVNFIFIFLLFLGITEAKEVTHQVRPNSNFESTALNNSCSTMFSSPFSYKCNPALFPYASGNNIQFSMVGKSEGDSIENGKKLIFEPITEEEIRELFKKKSYNSFTFNSDISFKTKWFELSYSPYYLLADLAIYNPTFPEIAIHVVNQETLRATSGLEVFKQDSQYISSISLGASLFYYKHLYENTVFSLYDLATQRPNQLVNFKSKYGVASDLGLFIKNDNVFTPNIALKTKNLFSKIKYNRQNANSALQLESFMAFENYSTFALGKSYKTFFGGIDLNLELPFLGPFKEVTSEQTTLGFRYNIKLFSLLTNYSNYYRGVGMLFESENFNIGISYSKEKDLAYKQDKFENSVYAGVEIVL